MKLMKIIDAHVHLDEKIGNFENSLRSLKSQMKQASVDRAVLLHLTTQPWDPREFSAKRLRDPNIKTFYHLNPFEPSASNSLKQAVKEWGFSGLKLHPRLHRFPIDAPEVCSLVKLAGEEYGVPVLIDAFPDGVALSMGFHPSKFAQLARGCPATKLIFAHGGGHYILDFMMIAKAFPNVSLDISFSVLYYFGGHVRNDFTYALKSTKCNRVMYGSDYPSQKMKESVEVILAILKRSKIGREEMEKLFYQNAYGLLWE